MYNYCLTCSKPLVKEQERQSGLCQQHANQFRVAAMRAYLGHDLGAVAQDYFLAEVPPILLLGQGG